MKLNCRATYVKNDVAEDDDEDTFTMPEEISEETSNMLESAAAENWGSFLSGGRCRIHCFELAGAVSIFCLMMSFFKAGVSLVSSLVTPSVRALN